ncbi:hypothetical protein DSO57_1027224 [Entomophthora muscae]|uniref:Uncharacterized protein n=1 Tax=Entomophthora muscae TaxID=34485 RepID=A0ACC2RGL3_9FUNG|nr:hypothetical protein DSO57_1027224 [Entomophthora muscae]
MAAAKPKPGTWEALSPQTLSEDLSTWPSMCLSSYGPVREQPCILTDTDISPEELHLFALQDFASTGTVQNFFGGLQGEVDKASRKLTEMQSRGPQAIIGHMQSQRIDHSRPLPDISPCPRLKKNSVLNASNVAFMQPNYRPSLNNPFEILNRPENQFGANVNAFASPNTPQGFGSAVPKATLNPNAFTQFGSQPVSNSFANPSQPGKEKAVPFSFAQSLNNLGKQPSTPASIFSNPKPATQEATKAPSVPAATPQTATASEQKPTFAGFSTFSATPNNFSGTSHTISGSSEKPVTPQQPTANAFSGFNAAPSQSAFDSKPKFSFAEKLASMASTAKQPTDASTESKLTSEAQSQAAPTKPVNEGSHETPQKSTEAAKPSAEETTAPKPAFFVPPNASSPFFKAPIETNHAKISQLVTPSSSGTPSASTQEPPAENKPPVQNSQEGVPAKEPQKTLTPEEIRLVSELNALHEYKEEFSSLDIEGLVVELDKMLSSISIRPSFSPMLEENLPTPIPFTATPAPPNVRNLPAYKALPPLPPPIDPQRAHAKLGDPTSYSTAESLAPWEIEAFTCSDFTPGAIPSKPPSIGLLFRKN